MKKIGVTILAMLLLMATSVTAYAQDSATISYDSLKYVAGDVDCNEKIDADDMVALREVLLDITKADRENTADANGDGDINIIDLVRMKKYFSNGFSVKLGK